MRQKSIGEVLKDARESRGWSFADVQRMTKIQARLVQALEYNDFEAIPDSDYTKSFLQRYAEILELDAEVLLDAYDSNSLVVYYEAREVPTSDIDLRRKVKKKPVKSYLPLIYLLLAAISILIFVTYIVSQRIQNQVITPPSTSSSYSVVSKSSIDQTSSPTSTVQTTETTNSSTSEEQSGVRLTISGGGASLAATLVGATKPVEVQVSVTTTTSWVSLSDTDMANGVTLSPDNTSVTTTIPDGVTTANLTLGVVEGVAVRIAGQELDTSALTEQSGIITLTIE